jgi:RHH-type proline utilization regulon transcriptional repressor/proline dehydrogenase/delta 1-pyrroline-5-carboxylate dehydrogenase
MYDVRSVPGVSVKLSALHPRYDLAQRARCVPELVERLSSLAQEAAKFNIALTVDAEESNRLALSLDIIEGVLANKEVPEWDGFGLAVQAYQKRALTVVDWVVDKAHDYKRRLQVRLVKGAYWDYEIKRAQEMGLSDYPVYTRKCHADVSYLTCAAQLLQQSDVIYPMFGTHNAHTIAAVMDMAHSYNTTFEFQSLYGMGQGIYQALRKQHDVAVSLYAPVGPHKDLLAYLVRRILENGANSSFVNQMLDDKNTVQHLVRDPVAHAVEGDLKPHKNIVRPQNLFAGEFAGARVNSQGLDFDDLSAVHTLYQAMLPYREQSFEAASVIGGKVYKDGAAMIVVSPVDGEEILGKVWSAHQDTALKAVEAAHQAFPVWSKVDAEERATILERMADLLEENAAALMALLVREAGKTLPDAHGELREAVDFCRYYAARGRVDCASAGFVLPGPTGERNVYYRHGRGVFVCIAPWNFPLAIFLGQIAAALMAGNSVIAKPAEQTPLIAALVVSLLHQAGVHKDALNLVVGDGFIGAAIVDHPLVAGVAFTGSTEVARSINQSLAAKRGDIIPLIAETGGQNAMIVDSSALPEQVVDDVVRSAFASGGQRCSALRILCLQEDIAPTVLRLLRGAMQQLTVGNPWELSSDIGPIIDEGARSRLRSYVDSIQGHARLIQALDVPDDIGRGYYFAPHAYEIDQISSLKGEVFGPILHVYIYKRSDLDYVLGELNDLGYGLTLGVHSRIDSFVQKVSDVMRAGNVYVNREMIGAVVGSQPFGGQGLSGTGPKAGGEDYLRRFCVERLVSTDTTAAGGNASLVSITE